MWMKSSSSTVQAGRPVRPIQRASACSLTCCSTEFDLYLDPAAKAVSIDVCAPSLFGQPDFCIGVLVTGIWMRRKQRQLLSIQSTSVKVMSCEYKTIKCVCVYTVYYSSNSNNSIHIMQIMFQHITFRKQKGIFFEALFKKLFDLGNMGNSNRSEMLIFPPHFRLSLKSNMV